MSEIILKPSINVSSIVSDGITIEGNGTASSPVASLISEPGTAQGQVAFWDATEGKWVHTETNEDFWDDVNKRRGIGTATPLGGLHIKGADSASYLYVERTIGTTMIFQAGSTQGFVGTQSNHDFIITTNNANRVTVLKTGEVGINTTLPRQKLDVLGTIRSTYTDNLIYCDFSVDMDGYLTIAPTGSKILAGSSYTAPTLDYELAPKKYVDARSISTITQAATDTLTAAEVTNTIVNNYGQTAPNIQTMPTAGPDMNVIFAIGTAGAGAFSVKAAAGDKIYLDGTALDDADKVTCSTPAVGNMITFVSFQTGASAYDWIATTGNGTWSDGGA